MEEHVINKNDGSIEVVAEVASAKPKYPGDLEAMQKRIEQIYISVEKTRKYFMWTLIITIITVVLPLIALAFVIPFFMSSITEGYGI